MPPTRPTLLLTRPPKQSLRFAERCRTLLGDDVPVVISPVLTIRPRDVAVDLTGIAGVIATSANGIEALARIADVSGLLAYCVGDRTAAVATGLGMRAVSASGDAGDLTALILAEMPIAPLIYPRGAVTRGDIAAALRATGITVHPVVLYDQVPTALSDDAQALFQGGGRIVLPLFSPRSAELVGRGAAQGPAQLHIVAISQVVADAWTGPAPRSISVLCKPDTESMLAGIAEIYRRESS